MAALKLKEKIKDIYFALQYAKRYIVQHFYRYSHVGMRSDIRNPMRVAGGKRIMIGSEVFIMNGLRIEAICSWGGYSYKPLIKIDDKVQIGQNCHITCGRHIEIGYGCSLLPDVLITDIEHIYEMNKTLGETGIEVGSVVIGKYTVVGSGVRILGHRNIKIGKNVVIGANAVVTRDIPDNALAIGIPARIVGFRA